MMPSNPIIDVYCPYCQQMIVPADRMVDLSRWIKDETKEIYAVDTGPAILLNAKFLCKNCGRMVWFDLNEQRLKKLLNEMVRK
jgi:transposase-like protein